MHSIAENDACCHGSDISLVSVGTAIQILSDWILSMPDFALRQEEVREKDRQSKARKTGGKCRRKPVFSLQVCEWPGKGPSCVYASCYFDAFLLRSFPMYCVQSIGNYAALWAKCSRTSQIWALRELISMLTRQQALLDQTSEGHFGSSPDKAALQKVADSLKHTSTTFYLTNQSVTH